MALGERDTSSITISDMHAHEFSANLDVTRFRPMKHSWLALRIRVSFDFVVSKIPGSFYGHFETFGFAHCQFQSDDVARGWCLRITMTLKAFDGNSGWSIVSHLEI